MHRLVKFGFVQAVKVRKGMLRLLVFRHGQFWQLRWVELWNAEFS